MKLYITGIAGLLGNNIVKTLVNRCEITGVDIVSTIIPNITYSHFSLFETDLLRDDLKAKRPDVVIHTAAWVNVDDCELYPEEADRLNHITTGNIADICNELGIKMVYISTDAVFDGNDERLYSEDDIVNPLNVYAKTKLDGEHKVRKYSQNLIMRTNIYGQNIQNKKSFGEWIVSSLKDNQTLNMFEDIDFSPILVNDLAEIIYKALQNDLSGIYHVCGTGCISKYDFGIKLKQIFGIDSGVINKSSSESMKFKARRSKHMGMSNEKIKKELGIRIRTPEESIVEFKRLYEEML